MLTAPFPYFGGKSKVADMAWQRFGDCPNYVEPFFGSGAVMLRRPHWPFAGDSADTMIHRETINDLDSNCCNFWRATRDDPDAVAYHADRIVSELDLHAIGDWLFCSAEAREFVESMRGDRKHYDAERAGCWCWFVSNWIGGLPSVDDSANKNANGVYRRLTHLSDAGNGVSRQLASAGTCEAASAAIREWMQRLSDRLRYVRVECGNWDRILGPSVTWKNAAPCAVFLDPPYSAEAGRNNELYSTESGTVAHDVRAWCLEHGDMPEFRIALCGYEVEHDGLESRGWQVVEWKAQGGYSNLGTGGGKENCHRERVWFSPYCLKPAVETQGTFFGDDDDGDTEP